MRNHYEMELMEFVECVLPDWTREHCENYLALMKIDVCMELLALHKDIYWRNMVGNGHVFLLLFSDQNQKAK